MNPKNAAMKLFQTDKAGRAPRFSLAGAELTGVMR
mgnify:CR=1 FL=1